MSTIDTGPPATVGGRYTLGDLIGRGGAADVYRARDELLGRDVAIKMFAAGGAVTEAVAGDGADGPGTPDKVGDVEEGQEARHRREVLTLAGLSHPGLVTVYDVGDEDSRAYFVMQLIEGDTLAQRVRAGPLDVVDVVALGAALADALSYVHRRGVVHRDVKPGNVLLDVEGRAHLSDFGIAAVHDAAPVTAAGMVIGTASYLSPEQVRGEAIDDGVDIYALGLVLIECLTGRREYPGQALEAAVARLHRRPGIPEGLTPALTALLTAMTADTSAERPSADEVVGALRGISREVGMDAETVLSPVLMSAPTMGTGSVAAGTLAAGPSVHVSGPDSARNPAVVPGLGPAAAAGAAPSRSPRRRRIAVGAMAAATLLVAGSAVGYAMLSQATPPPPPPVSTVAPPLPLPPISPLLTTTTRETEAATAPRSRRTTSTTTRRPTTTTATTTRNPPPVVPPAPIVPPTTTDEPVPPTTEPTSPRPQPF